MTVGLTYSSLKMVSLFCVLIVTFDTKTGSQALCDIPYGQSLALGTSSFEINVQWGML
jgi:hypothetical protein